MNYDIENQDAAKTIRLFNAKSQRLWGTNFVKEIFAKESGCHFKFELLKTGDFCIDSSCIGPERDAIEAFVLTFRFFIQNMEKISIHNMVELYRRLEICTDIKSKIAQISKNLNEFLDSASFPKIMYNNKMISNREIMNTVIYGDLAHSNNEKIFEKWMSKKPLDAFVSNSFNLIMLEVLNSISEISELNEKVLKQYFSEQ